MPPPNQPTLHCLGKGYLPGRDILVTSETQDKAKGMSMQTLEMNGRAPPYPEVWHGKCSLLLRRTLHGEVHG